MENLVNIFAENVARGNFVQIGPNFPAKKYFKQHLVQRIEV